MIIASKWLATLPIGVAILRSLSNVGEVLSFGHSKRRKVVPFGKIPQPPKQRKAAGGKSMH